VVRYWNSKDRRAWGYKGGVKKSVGSMVRDCEIIK